MSAQEFLRTLLGVEVGLVLKFDPIARRGRNPEGVHQLRVCARRLRAELKIVAPALRKSPLRHLERELKWVGGVLGEHRDLDVLDELLRSVTNDLSPTFRSSIAGEVHVRQRRTGVRVVELLASQRYRELVGALTDACIHPPVRPTANRPAIDLVRPSLSQSLHALFDAADGFGDTPTNDQLHRIRILSKRARYSAEVAAPLIGASAKRLGQALEEVQTILGDLHDRFVARVFLDEQAAYIVLACGEAGNETDRSLATATSRLDESIEQLRATWRQPFERARTLGRPLVNSKWLELKGTGTQHEVE